MNDKPADKGEGRMSVKGMLDTVAGLLILWCMFLGAFVTFLATFRWLFG